MWEAVTVPHRQFPFLVAVGAVALVGSIVSAVWMVHLYTPGGDPSRVYYGTDTRAQAMLMGAVLSAMGFWPFWSAPLGIASVILVAIRMPSVPRYVQPPSTMKSCAVHIRLSSAARNSALSG